MRSHYCGHVNESLLGQTVTVAGWVQRRRDHGGVIFIDLRDRDGLVQVVCDPDAPELFAIAESLRNEFVVSITGLVRARPAGTANANLASGKVEMLARRIDLLNRSEPLPFQLDEQVSEEVRLKYRYLDLRRDVMAKRLRQRHAITRSMRQYLDDAGFVDIETPMLTTNSLRRLSATANSSGASGSQTTWTNPSRSRRSMKITPPWSRRRCTQPATVTVCSSRESSICPQ